MSQHRDLLVRHLYLVLVVVGLSFHTRDLGLGFSLKLCDLEEEILVLPENLLFLVLPVYLFFLVLAL